MNRGKVQVFAVTNFSIVASCVAWISFVIVSGLIPLDRFDFSANAVAQRQSLSGQLLNKQRPYDDGQEIRFDALISENWAPMVTHFHVDDDVLYFAAGGVFEVSDSGRIRSRGSANIAIFSTQFPEPYQRGSFQVEPKLLAYCIGNELHPRVLTAPNEKVFIEVTYMKQFPSPLHDPDFPIAEGQKITREGMYLVSNGEVERVDVPASIKFGPGLQTFQSRDRRHLTFVSTNSDTSVSKMCHLDVATMEFSEIQEIELMDERSLEYAYAFSVDPEEFWVRDEIIKDGVAVYRMREIYSKKEFLMEEQLHARITGNNASFYKFINYLGDIQPVGNDRLVEISLDENQSTLDLRFTLKKDEEVLRGFSWARDDEQLFLLAELKKLDPNTSYPPLRFIQISLDKPRRVIRHDLPAGVHHPIRRAIAANGYLYYVTGTLQNNFGNMLGIARYRYADEGRKADQ